MFKNALHKIDSNVNLIVILFLFWALFWSLNGGDKFLNGDFKPNTESWSAKGVLVNQAGDMEFTLHPMEDEGWYGVNRDSKMINYFQNISMRKELALGMLYGIAIFEVILGFTFFALFIWCIIPNSKQSKDGLFADRTVHRLAFKSSVIIFVMFSIGDILFGDRTELWEHGTSIILTLITYDMWYRADRFSLENRQKQQENKKGSIQAATYQEEAL